MGIIQKTENMDRKRFLDACAHIAQKERRRDLIGTLSEKSIHAVLKEYYEPKEFNQEIKLGSFYADIVGENGIIEIQTHHLFKLQKKLDIFLEYSPVTVVHPVISETAIVYMDEKGNIIRKRKSPLKATVYDALFELYSIKYTLDNPNMRVIIPLLKAEDHRYQKLTKHGNVKYLKGDKIPFDIEEELVLSCPDDYRAFLPGGLRDEFCSDDFSKAAKINISCARICLNILCYLKIVEKRGKKGNKIIYRIADI